MSHLHRARQYGRRTWCARRSSTQTTWMRYATRFSRCDCPGRSNCNGPTRAVNDASRSSTFSAASTRCRPSSPIAVNPTGRQSATAESAWNSSTSSSPRWASRKSPWKLDRPHRTAAIWHTSWPCRDRGKILACDYDIPHTFCRFPATMSKSAYATTSTTSPTCRVLKKATASSCSRWMHPWESTPGSPSWKAMPMSLG